MRDTPQSLGPPFSCCQETRRYVSSSSLSNNNVRLAIPAAEASLRDGLEKRQAPVLRGKSTSIGQSAGAAGSCAARMVSCT
jgi:hypothetical protein